MSAFECNITPTRIRNEIKRNEDREPTIVNLRPFSGKSIVSFENVPVTKAARRSLIIINDFDQKLKVSVTKQPKPELNLTIEWSVNYIDPNSQKNLEVEWKPTKVVACREVIQITDENGNKKDVSIIFKSCELKRTTTTKRAGPAGFPKKLKLISPTAPKSFTRSNFDAKPSKLSAVNTIAPSSPLRNTLNLSNQPDRINFSPFRNIAVDKENTVPLTPKNATNIFDNIRFTPVTETKPKCDSKLQYLCSLPTPVGAKRDDIVLTDLIPRRNLADLAASPEKIESPPHSLSEAQTPQPNCDRRELLPIIEYQLTEESVTEVQMIKIDVVLGNTLVVPSNRKEEQTGFHKTFEVSKSHSFTSFHEEVTEGPENKLRVNIGSTPNLNEINSVGTIESNRYYSKQPEDIIGQNLSIESIVSNADFRETEICAQSSCYNLNELVSPRSGEKILTDTTPKKENRDSPRRQDVKNRSPSFFSIQKMTAYKDFKSPPPMTSHKMEFSPGQTRSSTWKQKLKNQQAFAMPRVPRDLHFQPRPNLSTQSLHSISSCSVASAVSAVSTCSTPAKMTSGKLYNENHINAYNLKDPFSATTTFDPFLSSTMYLDERTLDSIEKTYMKWLNALVTIPADLESDRNEKIDVGKLFNDVQSKELALAPTKELVCSRYYTSRLDSLRTAAVRFFHSEAIAGPLNKLTVIINEKNKLDVKAERNIHLDLVLQRSILELLLCFNPLWLRIGLEVVFNVQLNLQSNQDILGMSRFIVTTMFKSQYLAEKYSKFSQQKEYLDKLRKHTVKSFLFVLFFLDRAKESRLIKQNPCLFVKRAPYKESNEILKKFASLAIANYGDIVKTLRRFDYTLTHKQTVIDEFDFAFKNLAVDLRDGVRLTKVMEVILLRDDLVQKVRVPAISRLQKVYNVDLALKALEAAEYKILGNITSKDIADGHREKTLSLLWQIIYKFRAPRFNAAAKTIQTFWRSKYLMVVINKRIEEKRMAKLNQAATIIQKYYRGWKARQATKVYRKRITKASVTIQKTVRGFLARQRLQKVLMSIVSVQRWYRRTLVSRSVRGQFLLQRKSSIVIQNWWRCQLLSRKLLAAAIVIRTIKQESLKRHESAIVIQSFLKSVYVHKKFRSVVQAIVCCNRKDRQENRAAVKFQSLVRMRIERKQFLQLKSSTLTIQSWWRNIRKGKKQHEEFVEIKQSTVRIQQWFRGVILMKIQRSEFIQYRKCVINVQERFRANLAMKKQRSEYQKLKMSTVILQKQIRAWILMKMQRSAYQTLRCSTIVIQRRFQATLMMKRQRFEFIQYRNCVLNVQSRFRANLMMKSQRSGYLMLKKSAVCLQQRFRALTLMKKQLTEFQKLRQSTIVIQRYLRATLLMKRQRTEFVCYRNNVVTVQVRFRANLSMKRQRTEYEKLKKSAVILQQHVRAWILMRKQRAEYQTLRTSTIVIQRHLQATLLMRRQRVEFIHYRNCVLNVQSRFRAKLEMKKQKLEYQKLKMSVVCLQQHVRAWILMRKERTEYQSLRQSTITIQRFFKTRIQRRQYLKLKTATVFIQLRYRAQLLMRQERKNYETLRNATIIVQRRFRSSLESKKQRNQFLVLKTAALVIQRRFRATQLMKVQLLEFQGMRTAAVKIQAYFRSYQEMKNQRNAFLKMRSSAVCVQQRFRANLKMRLQRDQFLKEKESANKIKLFWRAYQMMKRNQQDFNELKTTTIMIQQRYRAKLEMRRVMFEYRKKREAVVRIQQFWKATLEMRKEKLRYQQTISTVISIQRWFRAYQLVKIEKQRLAEKKAAVVKIQQWFRNYLLMTRVRHQFLLLKKTVLLVENRVCANRLMQSQQSSFVDLKRSTVFVQRRFRSKLECREAKKFVESVKVVIKLQARVRGLQARNRFQALQTPERIEMRRKHKAARSIQAAWRGYKERSKKSNRCFKEIVKRLMKATKNVDPAQTLAEKLKISINFLKEGYDSNLAITFLAKLEYMARTVPWILIDDAEFVSSFCYGLMAQAIRSEVDKQIIELCSCIILNLSRYKDTKESAFQEFGLLTISQMLLRWCDKDCGIFNTLCTLVWVFAHCETKQKIIRDFILMKDGEFIVAQIKQNVLRKENMRKNSRRPIGFQSISLTKYKKDYQLQLRYQQPQPTVFSTGFITPEMLRQCREMPSLEPDYGIVKTFPYIFYSSVFAFDNVLKALGIKHA